MVLKGSVSHGACVHAHTHRNQFFRARKAYTIERMNTSDLPLSVTSTSPLKPSVLSFYTTFVLMPTKQMLLTDDANKQIDIFNTMQLYHCPL